MIRTLLHNRRTGETQWGAEELFTQWANDPDYWIWADFDAADPLFEREYFRETFDLDLLVIADAQRKRHPPKLEVFDEYFFLLVQGLGAANKGIDFKTIQIALFVSDRFMITHRKAESVSIDKAWSEAQKGTFDMAMGPTHFAYRIVRHVTDRYTHLVEGIEYELEKMEDEMFENPRDALLGDLLSYGRNLKRLRRIFNYHQGIFTQLSRKDHPFVGKKERHEFTDAFEHTERLATLTALFGDIVNDLMNGYISVTSHRLNHIIKVLTIVTVVFLPLTLLVGVYGMNFENMPELHYKNGYFFLLGAMGTIVACLVVAFRKLKWI